MKLSEFWVVLAVASQLTFQTTCTHLLMSTHDYPYNLIVIQVNPDEIDKKARASIPSESLLDTANMVVKNSNLHFRGIWVSERQIYVANSDKDHSFIGHWEFETDPSTNDPLWENAHRDLFLTQFDSIENPLFIHPFGIAFNSLENIFYVTCQNTDTLIGIDGDTGAPIESVPNGVIFRSFSQNENENGNENAVTKGVRGVVFDEEEGYLFVAHELVGKVLVFKVDEEGYSNIYNLSWTDNPDKSSPVSLALGAKGGYPNRLYVGDIESDRVIAFYYDENEWRKLWKSQRNARLDHPSGMAVTRQYVYVVSQNANQIVRIHPVTGQFRGVLWNFDDRGYIGEDLIAI